MGFIHHEQGKPDAGQCLLQFPVFQGFRGYKEEPQFPGGDAAQHGAAFLRLQGGVEARGGYAQAFQGFALVAHECDEW